MSDAQFWALMLSFGAVLWNTQNIGKMVEDLREQIDSAKDDEN